MGRPQVYVLWCASKEHEMRNYKIRVGIKHSEKLTRFYPYLGETEETVSSNLGGDGWNVANHGKISVLGFGEPDDEPYEISGDMNFKSHIDRIIRRIRGGYINPMAIVVNISEEERCE